jgi:hypothetical protein
MVIQAVSAATLCQWPGSSPIASACGWFSAAACGERCRGRADEPVAAPGAVVLWGSSASATASITWSVRGRFGRTGLATPPSLRHGVGPVMIACLPRCWSRSAALGVRVAGCRPVCCRRAAGGNDASPRPCRRRAAYRSPWRRAQFWLVLVYAICGFGDFFVSTHVVAFAQDRGISALFAGNLLALMGLTGLLGVLLAGYWSDRAGPVWPTALCFLARAGVFALVLIDQSPLSIGLFALVFGLTFLVTAPLTVIFVRERFGTRNLGRSPA